MPRTPHHDTGVRGVELFFGEVCRNLFTILAGTVMIAIAKTPMMVSIWASICGNTQNRARLRVLSAKSRGKGHWHVKNRQSFYVLVIGQKSP